MILSCLTAVSQDRSINLRHESGTIIKKSDFQSLRAVFSYNSLESFDIITDKGIFSEIIIDGTYPSGEIGTPQLPATHKLLAVPYGATPTATVISYTSTDYNLSDLGIKNIIPHQPSVRKDQRPEDVTIVYDEESYQTRGLATSPEVTIEVQGIMRGIRIGSLVVNPVSYNAKDNIIRVFNDIEVEVIFDGADIAETKRMLVNTYTPYFDIVYKQMFNYSQIMNVYDDHPDLMTYPVHMLVITPPDFLSALEPWTNWKIQKGFDVDVRTTAQIGSSYNAIQSFIQYRYQYGLGHGGVPTFVILVGDIYEIPATMGSQTNHVTDLYYGSIDDDYFPEMFYSRMSAENTAQLTNIINKILQYEKYTMPDPNYLNNVTLIAGWDDYWLNRIGIPTVNYSTNNYYNSAHGFNNVNKYIDPYNGCYDALSSGIGFVNYQGHGDDQMWYEPLFTNHDVNQLSNTGKYFLAMGNCCKSGNFGNDECLGEAMIRRIDKGAYTYIGSCPNSYWIEDYYFSVGATNVFYNTPTQAQTSTGVYDGIWMDDTYNTVSSMTFLGNLAVCYAYVENYSTSGNPCSPTYYWEAYHVLGDASIMPYRVKPTANTVSHANIYPINDTIFNVHAEAGSYVGISMNNELLGCALIPDGESVEIPVTPVTSGKVRIVVTKPQRRPYIKDIWVEGTTPYYDITATVNPKDAGTVTGTGTYDQGTQCTLTATAANEHYHFSKWTKNGQNVSTDATYTFTVTQAGNYVANFTIDSYQITATADPADGATVTGGGTYALGAAATLKVTPNTGYRFLYWTRNDAIYSYFGTINIEVSADATFVAHLEKKSYQVNLSVSPIGSGTATGEGTYLYGDTVKLVATANSGYEFYKWVSNTYNVSNSDHYTFTITEDREFTAVFHPAISVDENDVKPFAIYPNPADDIIVIEAEETIIKVEIYDPTGLMVLHKDFDSNNTSIDVSTLQSGVYVINLTTGSGTVTRRFVKN